MAIEWTSISPFHLTRDLLREVGEEFGLKPSETAIFNELWKIKEKSDQVKQDAEKSGALDAEIKAAFAALKTAVEGGTPTKVGHQKIKRIPTTGRYVIFSDLHMAFDGSRHDFFRTAGNRDLYEAILAEYFENDYTLIENGDIEELLIFEPTLAEAQARSPMNWGTLNERRRVCRLAQLSKVIVTHRLLYEQIAETFHSRGRYLRITGNHDADLHEDAYTHTLQTRYPGLQVYDQVILEPQDVTGHATGYPDFIIAHGHQFDKSCNPAYAGRIGEVISECLSWAFQGADRTWLWNDEVSAWATGAKPLNNLLVEDEPSAFKVKLDPQAVAADPAFWETVFNHNVAWEYFEESTAGTALSREVLTGNEFMKFRHMNELVIRTQLAATFANASKTPALVLGHSHEPRYKPAYYAPALTRTMSYYNTGSAGRFQNLIWGLEIVEGEARLVGWYRPGGPITGGKPERRVFRSAASNGLTLQASAKPIPLTA